MTYLLDTNIWIYAFKDLGGCRERLRKLPDDQVFISAVTVMELSYGMARSARPLPMRMFLDGICKRYTVLDFCSHCAEHAGSVRAELGARGTPIGPFELQIAATALKHQLTMATRNTAEFARVPMLRVENWWVEPA